MSEHNSQTGLSHQLDPDQFLNFSDDTMNASRYEDPQTEFHFPSEARPDRAHHMEYFVSTAGSPATHHVASAVRLSELVTPRAPLSVADTT